jgi:hypothetical protein
MQTIWISIVLVASVFAPSFLGIALLWAYRKWQDRDGRTCPIANKRIYGAGEQLRKRIDDETAEMSAALMVLLFIGPYFVAAWALIHFNREEVKVTWGTWMLVAGFLLMLAWALRKIIRHGTVRRRCLAGLKAELFTAQELNRLMGSGCIVLHDVPGEGFNLDHVIVGPHAVYVVETKSVRKPRKGVSNDHFKVLYDGEALRFPDFISRKPMEQARRQARWLAEYFKRATGRQIPVIPVVALPGWWVDSAQAKGKDIVRVFNPSGRGANFMTGDGAMPSIDVGVASLLSQALVMRYPVDT